MENENDTRGGLIEAIGTANDPMVTLRLTESDYKALMDLASKHDPSSRLYIVLEDSTVTPEEVR